MSDTRRSHEIEIVIAHVSVIMHGRAQKAEAKVSDSACLNVFQPMQGG